MNDPRTSKLLSKDALLCGFLVLLCLLAIWPAAEIGINDDWSYLLTTQQFLRTHHFVYNGWATAMLGWQVLWGALFGWLFGPSFSSIRFSMIPVAMATAVFYYAILRRFSLNRAHALFGTLTLVLSPLFLALSATFMSDVPGLFSIVLCLYLCQRALAAETDRRAALWLVIAAATNVLSGTVRQIAWLGVLVMVPSCAWLMRRRRYVVPTAIVCWVAGAVSIKLLLVWFLSHPYSVPETLDGGAINAQIACIFAERVARGAITLLIFLLPVLTVALCSLWPVRRRIALPALAVVSPLVGLLAILHHLGLTHVLNSPWLGNTFSNWGLLRDRMFSSAREIPLFGRQVLFLVVVLCTLAVVGSFFVYRRRSAEQHATAQHTASWQSICLLLLPLLISYTILLVPRAAFRTIFDRYLLVTLAVTIVFPLVWHQEHVSDRIPVLSIALLGVFSVLAVADLHDLFSMSRAEVRMARALENVGVPRTEVDGGFAFDFETQARAWGYVNDWHIINPRDAYRPQPAVAEFQLGSYDCALSTWQRYLPAVHARYRIFTSPTPCVLPPDLPTQTYTTWLQPGKHYVFAGILRTPPK
jgi:hypothetical protein